MIEAFTGLLELFDADRFEGAVGGTGHRVRWARIATLFAAFAAEGYINGALRKKLSARDFDAVDRLSTPDKYVLGATLAFKKPLFDRRAEPVQSIQALFELRNSLAHPKPRTVTITKDEMFADPNAEVFKPSEAVRFVMAVAEAATTLNSALEKESDPTPQWVLGTRAALTRRAAASDLLPRPTVDDYRALYERVLGASDTEHS